MLTVNKLEMVGLQKLDGKRESVYWVSLWTNTRGCEATVIRSSVLAVLDSIALIYHLIVLSAQFGRNCRNIGQDCGRQLTH